MTQLTNTGLLEKTLSNVFPNKKLSLLAEILLLFVIGALAAVLHAKLRLPMQMPGRHGLVFMAAMIIARSVTRLPYASSLTFAGAAGIMAIFPLGIGGALAPLIYLVTGFFCDLLFRISPFQTPKVLIAGLISGISWMLIPIIRMILTLTTGMYFDAFRFGFAYPILTHLIFGFVGGMLGFSLFQIFMSKEEKQ
jgi:hypothetical protein